MSAEETSGGGEAGGRVPAELPAYYALRPGGWRDAWTLLHPPYTIWHLSYVAIGAALAPVFRASNMCWSLLAFFLAMGVSAHALDELKGRPLRTDLDRTTLLCLAGIGLAGAIALGVLGCRDVSPWLACFMVIGGWTVPAYSLEWFGGRFHTDLVFALAWGGFPALVGYFAQDGRLGTPAVLAAVGCSLLAAAQRALSTPVRMIRRHAVDVRGELELDDGSRVKITSRFLRDGSERALKLMPWAVASIAAGLVASRL